MVGMRDWRRTPAANKLAAAMADANGKMELMMVFRMAAASAGGTSGGTNAAAGRVTAEGWAIEGKVGLSPAEGGEAGRSGDGA